MFKDKSASLASAGGFMARWSIGLLCAVFFLSVNAGAIEKERTGGPYVPTPPVVVDHMLRMANLGPGDFVIDLGSGDGVIVLTAAKQFHARGFGVDIDPKLVRQSNARARDLGVADRAAFHVQDVFKADVSKASVLTLYLLPKMMSDLRSKLFNELRAGARIVSHDYRFDGWEPDGTITLDVPEKEAVNGIPRAIIHLWVVPAKVTGRWQLRIEGAPDGAGDLDIRQRYQTFEGDAVIGGRKGSIERASLRGEEIRFRVMTPTGEQRFTGTVNGGTMQGAVELPGGKDHARWTAVRPPD
jgi:phospholipid N-methyltransferase